MTKYNMKRGFNHFETGDFVRKCTTCGQVQKSKRPKLPVSGRYMLIKCNFCNNQTLDLGREISNSQIPNDEKLD